MRFIIALLITFFIEQSLTAGIFLPDENASLEESKELKKDVEFWESIFSKYEADHCVYHDSKHLDMIFWVSSIPLNDRRAKRSQMKRQKKQIKQALYHLGKGRTPKSWLQKRIAGATPKALRHPRYYRGAASRIRCQRGVATDFRKSLERSKKYIGMIRDRFKSMGLPLDLAYLPHLESGFNSRAHSKAGARGLWQLMPATARQYITVNRHRDDRIHPYKATKTAAKILKSNFRRTRSWPLAITAYNYGINGIVRAMKRYNTSSYEIIRKRHRTRIFGFAARNFYPSFLAVRNLAKAEGQAKKIDNIARRP